MHTSRTLILEEEEEREVASVPDLLMIQGRGVLAPPDGPIRRICPVPVRNHFHAMRPLLAPRRKIEFGSHFPHTPLAFLHVASDPQGFLQGV